MDAPGSTQKIKKKAGIYAAKTLEQHLCERLNDSDSLHVITLSV
jgi:hypothetical protein